MQRRHFLSAAVSAPFATTAVLGADENLVCKVDAAAAELLTDWPNLKRYDEQNQQIKVSNQRIDFVFMGDSITQGWPDKRPAFFTPSRICRGIGGQTTGQMVLRMMADVVAIKPRAVHILAGTNDVAGNTGPMTTQQTIDNIRAMIVLSTAHGIEVLLGSIPPAASFPWRPGLETAQKIIFINKMLASLAEQYGSTFVDYTLALSDGAGAMKAGFAYDGVHPDSAGYAAMEAVLTPFISRLE